MEACGHYPWFEHLLEKANSARWIGEQGLSCEWQKGYAVISVSPSLVETCKSLHSQPGAASSQADVWRGIHDLASEVRRGPWRWSSLRNLSSVSCGTRSRLTVTQHLRAGRVKYRRFATWMAPSSFARLEQPRRLSLR